MIDKFMKKESLIHNLNVLFDYCKFCPQGEHQELSFFDYEFDEHSKLSEGLNDI